jgi:hypothetical protein
VRNNSTATAIGATPGAVNGGLLRRQMAPVHPGMGRKTTAKTKTETKARLHRPQSSVEHGQPGTVGKLDHDHEHQGRSTRSWDIPNPTALRGSASGGIVRKKDFPCHVIMARKPNVADTSSRVVSQHSGEGQCGRHGGAFLPQAHDYGSAVVGRVAPGG